MLEGLSGGLLSVGAIVIVFGIIVLVHEWGHMIAAKLCGVAVPDFALGMGPSLFSRMYRGTRYHLCAFPIGGFVQIAGLTDDPLNKTGAVETIRPENTNGGRLTKKWQDLNGWQKAFILVAGVCMNFVLAVVMMLVQGLAGFPNNSVVISGVEPGMPAAAAGVQQNDVLLALDGRPVRGLQDFVSYVADKEGQPVELRLLRGAQELVLTASPVSRADYNGGKVSLGVGLEYVSEMTNRVSLVMPNNAASRLGIKRGERIVAYEQTQPDGSVESVPVTDGLVLLLALPGFDEKLRAVDAAGEPIPAGGGTPLRISVEGKQGTREVAIPGDVSAATLGLTFTPRLERLPPLESVQRSLSDGRDMMLALLGSFSLVFTKAGAESISGPIGIFSILGQSAQSDWHTFLMWVILININLGVMNLLPLPALDGGRLVFVALAGIGLRVPEKREALVHAAGMILLLSFMLLVSIRDIGGLIGFGR